MGLFKKNQGSITVYLSIILSILLVLTGVLVDGARARAAESQVQSTAESAANSLLANYNNILKDWFGLMSMAENNPAVLEEELTHYINRNLMTELGAEKTNLSDESWNYVKKFLNVDNKFQDVRFLDMYDYRIEDVRAVPLYNLSENEVLRAQIVEYMKYRAPEVLGEEFLEKVNILKSYKKQSEVLSSKLAVDKSLNNMGKEFGKLSNAIEDVNRYDKDMLRDKIDILCDKMTDEIVKGKEMEYYKEELKNEKDKKKEYISSDVYKSARDSLKAQKDAAVDPVQKAALQTKIDNLTLSYDEAIEDAKKDYEEAASQYMLLKFDREDIIKDIYSNIDKYYKYNETAIDCAQSVIEHSDKITQQINVVKEQIKGDNSDFAQKTRLDLSKIENQISKDKMEYLIKKFKDNLNFLGDKKNEEEGLKGEGLKERISVISVTANHEYLKDLSRDDRIKIFDVVCQRIVKVDNLINNYVSKYSKVSSEEFPIEKSTSSSEKVEDPREASKDLIDSSNNPLKELEAPKVHKDFEDIKKGLPSGGAKINSEDILKAFVSEDFEFVKNIIGDENDKDLSEPREIINGMDFKDEDNNSLDQGLQLITGLIGFLEKGLENLRDEIYVDEYALGTFNNYLSTKELNVKEGNTISQIDLRGRNRSERKPYMYFENEIEYILGGHADDNLNVYDVMAKILLIRFTLNTIHVYMDPTKSQEALVAATAIATATGLIVTGFAVPIIKTLIILSWSMAESILDVKCLMSGKSVVIFKTRDTWVLSPEGGLKKIKEMITGTVAQGVQTYAKKAVNYQIDNFTDVANATTENVYDTINTKIENIVGKFFEPVDSALNSSDKMIKDNYEQITSSLENELSDLANDDMSAVVKEIYKLAEEEYKKLKGEIQNKLTLPIDKAREEIEDMKQSIMNTVDGKLSPLKESIKTKITEAAKGGKEAIGKYIDSFGSKSAKTAGNGYNNVKASILSLNYEEYLRLLLLMTNKDKKITRIQDLIQLQMVKMTENEKFKLSDCNTYVGVRTKVSMKYFFMTQAFVKKELKTEDFKRHNLYVMFLKGY